MILRDNANVTPITKHDTMIQELLHKLGIHYERRTFMRRGIDWTWDLQRLRTIGEHPVVFDVGANEGQTVSTVLKAFPAARIHSFEPVKQTFELLDAQFRNHPNVTCNRCAVSNTSGEVRIVATQDSEMSHLLKSEEEIGNASDIQTVESVTIDGYCSENGIDRIDVLKTDTEGNDLDVLKGGERMLENGQIYCVFTEATFNPTDDQHSQFTEMSNYLNKYGFTLYCCYDFCYSDESQELLFCNALFVRSATIHNTAAT